MASFRQRGTRWNVQIIRKNHPRLSKTFATKDAGKCWARKVEKETSYETLVKDKNNLKEYVGFVKRGQRIQSITDDMVKEMHHLGLINEEEFKKW